MKGPELQSYLARIGWAGSREPTLAVLEGLLLHHVQAIPFENLDIHYGRPIRLDLPSLLAKLVGARRGGYCFEQNALLRAALLALGFAVAPLEARVRRGATARLARTHMVLRVEAGGRSWLADGGFGGDGLLGPVALDGEVSRAHGDRVALFQEEGVHVLRRGNGEGWADLYAFTLEEACEADYAMASHYTSTHPASPFVRTPTVQRLAPQERLFLRGRTFTERRGERESVRDLGREEILPLVRDRFGLGLPAWPDMEALPEKD